MMIDRPSIQVSTTKRPLITALDILLVLFAILNSVYFILRESPVRLTIYLSPVLALLILLPRILSLSLRSQLNLEPFKNYLKPLLLLQSCLIGYSFLVLVFVEDVLYPRFFEEAIFILAPLLFAMFVSFCPPARHVDIYVKALFVVTIILYLYDVSFQLPLRQAITLLETLFVDSTSISSESFFAFSFGAFSLFFIFRRNWTLTAIAMLLMLLSYKRIVLAAFLVALLAHWILRLRPLHSRFIPILAVTINLLIAFLIFVFADGTLDGWMVAQFGIPPNTFTMGRRYLFANINSYFDVSWDNPPAFGLGLGRISDYLKIAGVSLTNPHSDILKYFLEFGPLAFVLWIYGFYRLHLYNRYTIVLAVFLNVLFLSDNVSIYFSVMFLFYLLNVFLMKPVES